jgi:hypothetical protein
MNNKNESINFLKNNQAANLDIGFIKKYYLPIFFASLTIIFIIVNLIITVFFVVRNNNYTEKIIEDKFEKYFTRKPIAKDPVQEAKDILQKEKKEFLLLNDMLGHKNNFMSTIALIIGKFSDAEGFYVRKIEYNGKTIRIDGELKKLHDLEEFEKRLKETGDFESVNISTKDQSSSRSTFSLTINQKI